MSVPEEGRRIYAYLVAEVIPRQTVATYQELNSATGVAFGPGGGHIGQVLGWVFRACERRGFPPITSVVVKAGEGQSELYDRPRNRYGMPSSGYFVALAESDKQAGRETAPGLERWLDKPPGFDKDVARWEYQDLIERHQESVWRHRAWRSQL